MSVILTIFTIFTIQALNTAALVALAVVAWRSGRGLLRSMDDMAASLASVLRSLAEIDSAWVRSKAARMARIRMRI